MPSTAMPFMATEAAPLDVQEITAATYTLTSFDMGKTLVFNRATAQVITAPAGLAKGFAVNIIRIGAGGVSITAGSGATVNGGGSSVFPRYTIVSISVYAANTFEIGGADMPVAQSTAVSIATTSTTDSYIVAPCAGSLESGVFTSVTALAASDTDYITFSITNLGLAGAGSAVMLAAADGNTTKTTGGAALVAFGSRSLTLSSTVADLVVVKGDVLRVRYTVTGTLGGAIAGAITSLTFSR